MKKLLTKIVAVMLATCFAFSLAACTFGDDKDGAHTGGSDPEPGEKLPGNTDDGEKENDDEEKDEDGFIMPEEGFNTSKEVTITFYHQMGASLRNVLDEYIAIFNKMYPNIHVKHKSQGDWHVLKDMITTELYNDSHPNIAYCYADHVAEYNVPNAVLTLNDFLADGALKDETVPTILVDENGDYIDENGNYVDEPVTKDLPLGLTAEQQAMYNPIYFDEGFGFGDGDKTYMLPWAKSTEAIFYNKEFFDEHGLTPPTTWDEMEETCRLIKEIDPDCVPLGYDSEENWFITMCEQLGSEYTSSESPHFRFNNQTNKDFVQKFKGWVCHWDINPDGKDYMTTAALANVSYTSELFLNEQIYMSVGAASQASYYSSDFEVGIAPIPQVDPAHPKMISQGPSVCIFKDEDPQKVLASWLFIKFMTTNPYYQTEFSSKIGYMPVLKSAVMDTIPAYTDWIALADGGTDLTASAVKMGMAHEQDYFVTPAFSGSSEARRQVGMLMQEAFLGIKSIDEAFRDALNNCTSRYGD